MIRNKKRKGQIAGQIFTYILAVIVIGGIALVGYNAIKSITTKACQAGKVTFNNNIEGMIEKYSSYGSVNIKELKVPCDYTTICFVASDVISDPTLPFDCDNKIIYESVLNNVKQNIFILSDKRTISIGYSEIISLNSTDTGECLCIEQSNGRFDIAFRGKGSTTEISKG